MAELEIIEIDLLYVQHFVQFDYIFIQGQTLELYAVQRKLSPFFLQLENFGHKLWLQAGNTQSILFHKKRW